MDKVEPKGKVWAKIVDKDGNVKFDGFLGNNIVTSAGKAAIAGLVGNTGAITAFTYLALGSATTAAAVTDTTLGTEISSNGLARAAATVSRVTTTYTNDTLQLQYTWTATGSQTINEIGVFNAASNGTMLSHLAPITAVVVANGDNFTATYKIQF